VVSQAIVLAVYSVVFALMRWRRPELFEGTSTADGPIARQQTVFGWALGALTDVRARVLAELFARKPPNAGGGVDEAVWVPI
jgi:hypothetical protein